MPNEKRVRVKKKQIPFDPFPLHTLAVRYMLSSKKKTYYYYNTKYKLFEIELNILFTK